MFGWLFGAIRKARILSAAGLSAGRETPDALDVGVQIISDASGSCVSPFRPKSGVDRSQAPRVSEGTIQEEILNVLRDGKARTDAEIWRALSATLPLSPAHRTLVEFRPNEEPWEDLVKHALSATGGNSLHAKGLIRSSGRGAHIIAESE